MQNQRYSIRQFAQLYRGIRLTISTAVDHGDLLPGDQQRELLRRLETFRADQQDLIPPAELDRLDPARGIEAVMDFLAQRHDAWERLEGEREETFHEYPDAGALYDKLLDWDDFSLDRLELAGETDLSLDLDGNDAFARILVLKNAAVTGELAEGELRDFDLFRDGGGFHLTLVLAGPGGLYEAGIDFDNLEVRVSLYDYSEQLVVTSLSGAPWELIAFQLDELREKAVILGMDQLNPREAELLPLAGFAPLTQFRLDRWEKLGEHPEAVRVFSERCRDSGSHHLVASIEEYAASRGRSRRRALKKLRAAMGEKASEALWRNLADAIRSPAGTYPKFHADPRDEEAERERVTGELKALGYAGEYPHFRKRGPLRGIHLAGWADRNWFVLPQKHMASLITCRPANDGDQQPTTGFVCSTVFLRDEEVDMMSELDGWSGFFADDWRRQGRVLYPKAAAIGITDLAARVAELESLNRHDRMRLITPDSPANTLLLILFSTLIGGSLFGVGMLLVAVLLSSVVSLAVTGSLVMVSELFRGLPPLDIVLMTGIPFGSIMGVFLAIMMKRLNL